MGYLTCRPCGLHAYAVLAAVSSCYPPRKGRLLMYYSPVRHSSPRWCVRLACIRHAASVHPEPGSNSPLSSILQTTSCLLDSFFLSKIQIILTCFCSVFNVLSLAFRRVLIYITTFSFLCKAFFSLFFKKFPPPFLPLLFFALFISIFSYFLISSELRHKEKNYKIIINAWIFYFMQIKKYH